MIDEHPERFRLLLEVRDKRSFRASPFGQAWNRAGKIQA